MTMVPAAAIPAQPIAASEAASLSVLVQDKIASLGLVIQTIHQVTQRCIIRNHKLMVHSPSHVIFPCEEGGILCCKAGIPHSYLLDTFNEIAFRIICKRFHIVGFTGS